MSELSDLPNEILLMIFELLRPHADEALEPFLYSQRYHELSRSVMYRKLVLGLNRFDGSQAAEHLARTERKVRLLARSFTESRALGELVFEFTLGTEVGLWHSVEVQQLIWRMIDGFSNLRRLTIRPQMWQGTSAAFENLEFLCLDSRLPDGSLVAPEASPASWKCLPRSLSLPCLRELWYKGLKIEDLWNPGLKTEELEAGWREWFQQNPRTSPITDLFLEFEDDRDFVVVEPILNSIQSLKKLEIWTEFEALESPIGFDPSVRPPLARPIALHASTLVELRLTRSCNLTTFGPGTLWNFKGFPVMKTLGVPDEYLSAWPNVALHKVLPPRLERLILEGCWNIPAGVQAAGDDIIEQMKRLHAMIDRKEECLTTLKSCEWWVSCESLTDDLLAMAILERNGSPLQLLRLICERRNVEFELVISDERQRPSESSRSVSAHREFESED